MSARAITRGDLAVVHSTDGSGIVMVTDRMRRLFNGVLIHTCPELATDADVSLPPGAAAPYPVVIQFDLHGTFYRSQVARVVGHVPIEGVRFGLDAYVAARAVAEALDAWRGLPVWPRTERWDFKVEQLRDGLQPLVRPFWSRFRW